MERVREFGIMLAVGFSPGKLFRMVMYESLWLGLVGLVGGALLTAWPYYYMATTGIDVLGAVGVGGSEVAGVAVSGLMKADIYPEHAVYIGLAALGATLLAGVFPALQAGRVEPVESIRLV
jgi:ABC-type lipoprotein release transport system permease subunit